MNTSSFTRQFLANVQKHGGVAKANKFLVHGFSGGFIKNLPKDVKDKLRDIKFYCDIVALPGRNLATSPFRSGSITREYIHSNNFAGTMNINFTLTDDMFIKNFFDMWQDSILPLTENDKSHQNIAKYPKDYSSDFKISKLTNDLVERPATQSFAGPIETLTFGDYIYTVKLRDAFPKNVNPIQLSFSSQENLKLSVELAFSSWSRLKKPE
tara:strand:- start:1539 stop:2171 length:633 start_codon:yes stop_codon:yes gene_type:complete